MKKLKIRETILLLKLPATKQNTMKKLIDFAERFGKIRGSKIACLSGLSWITACELLGNPEYFTQGNDELGKYFEFKPEWTA